MGIEVVTVAQTWLVGAVLEPRVIKVDALVRITMPDIWKKLESQGRGRLQLGRDKPQSEDGLVELSLEDILNINIPPQEIHERILYEIPDPILLDINTPFRYVLLLDKYLKHMPDEAILKLWVATNKGEYCSAPIYMFVLGNVFHAQAMTQEERELEDEVTSLLEKAHEHFEAGRYSEAKPILERAVELRENAQGTEHPDVVSIRHNIGVLNYCLGQFTEAEEIYKKTVPVKERQLGPDHPETVRCHRDLELLYEAWEKRIESARVILPENGLPQTTDGFFEDWQHLEDTERYQKAFEMGEDLISACEKCYGPDHEQLAGLFNKMGALYWKAGRYEDAADYFKHGLRIRLLHCGDRSSAVANSYSNLASAYREQGMFEQADRLYRQSIEILEGLGKHEELSTVLGFYRKLLRRMGREDDAEHISRRMEDMMTDTEDKKT